MKILALFRREEHLMTGTGSRASPTVSTTTWLMSRKTTPNHLAYDEVLVVEQMLMVIRFLSSAIAWFSCEGDMCQRFMSHSGLAYVSKAFANAFRTLGLCPISTWPYTPKANGKAARFIQALCREWTCAMPILNSAECNRLPPRFLAIHNGLRKHSALC